MKKNVYRTNFFQQLAYRTPITASQFVYPDLVADVCGLTFWVFARNRSVIELVAAIPICAHPPTHHGWSRRNLERRFLGENLEMAERN
jgi:hypothetical protein